MNHIKHACSLGKLSARIKFAEEKPNLQTDTPELASEVPSEPVAPPKKDSGSNTLLHSLLAAGLLGGGLYGAHRLGAFNSSPVPNYTPKQHGWTGHGNIESASNNSGGIGAGLGSMLGFASPFQTPLKGPYISS